MKTKSREKEKNLAGSNRRLNIRLEEVPGREERQMVGNQ